MRRRRFIRDALTIGGVAFAGGTRAIVDAFTSQSCSATPLGELLGIVPVHGDTARATPFNEILGRGLDARKFTDLSKLQADRLVTPTSEVFLRTTAPDSAREQIARWPLPLGELQSRVRPMGAHLIECSGNTDPDNFGLMSLVQWDGVPLDDYLSRLPTADGAAGVLVGGVDYPASSRSSAAGASWVFSKEAVAKTGAFLATQMNGAPLPLDHGAPVRLVVPGWYGCTWIKWVQDIRFIGADEPVTPQMIEFSLRTHQRLIPKRALDYEAPSLDLAATPIRVEKRSVDGRLEYRIVGIVWGGDRPVDRLMIRFRAGDPPIPFTLCPAPQTHRTWSLWEYRWHPPSPGVYNIALTAADPSIRTRRLDISFYVRRVVIDEV